MSADTTVKKVSSRASPHGEMDQTYLVSGKRVPCAHGRNEKPQRKPARKLAYETVGYVIAGQAELVVDGQTVMLEPGDSWLVPAGAEHTYGILTDFTAIEATSPPAQSPRPRRMKARACPAPLPPRSDPISRLVAETAGRSAVLRHARHPYRVDGLVVSFVAGAVDVRFGQCAPMARIISGGGFHPDSCRLELELPESGSACSSHNWYCSKHAARK